MLFEDAVRDEVLRRLKCGQGVSRALVARRLGVSERTLVRRLQERSTSFRYIVDSVRFSLAQQMILAGDQLDDVAAALGYADRRSLSYAVRRWS